jgi:hypothetical protein
MAYAGRKLKILAHVDRVEIFAGSKRLAVHERMFANNNWSLAPEHYLELIQQRPMAFASARVIRQWREHWPPVAASITCQLLPHAGRDQRDQGFYCRTDAV